MVKICAALPHERHKGEAQSHVFVYTMKKKFGELPRKFLLRVDQMVEELERVERPVDLKDVDIVILAGLTSSTMPRFDPTGSGSSVL